MTEDNRSGDATSPNGGQQFGQYIQWGISLFGSLAGVAGLLFAIGFLIVNINLMSYGVYEAGMLRERYISTGVAFLLLLAIIAVFWFFFIPNGLKRFLNRYLPQKLYNSFRGWGKALSVGSRETKGLRRIYNFFHDRGFDLFVVLLVTFGALILISLAAMLLVAFVWKISTDPSDLVRVIFELGDANFRSQRLRNLLSAMPVFLWCALVSLIFAVWRMWLNWNEIKAILSGTKEKKTSGATTGTRRASGKKNDTSSSGIDWQRLLEMLKRNWSYFFITLLLFLALVVYARNVFPVLPAAMGGGLPTVIQFSVKEADVLQELIQLGIPIEGNKTEQALNDLGIVLEDNETEQELSEQGIPIEENKLDLTRRITLIAQTGSSYIVLVPNAEINQTVAVSIPKTYVSGIIFYPEEYFLNDEYVAELHTQQGLEALKLGDYLTAIEKFNEATDRKDDYLPAFIGLGDTYVAQQIAGDYACKRSDCIKKAIKSYKNALCPTGNSQDCEKAMREIDETLNAEAPANGETLTAEALYKLSRAYALLINSQEDTEPEDTELDFLEIHCPEIKVNGEDTVDYIRTVTSTLECAIEVDKESENPQNYAEEAKNDHIFHLEKTIKLLTDDEFIGLLFPPKIPKKEVDVVEVVRRLSMEASDLHESGDYETAIDRFTWAITLLKEPRIKSFKVEKEKPSLYLNRASLYLELHGEESRHCEDGNCLGKAIKDYEDAVELEPNNATYLMGLAEALRIDLQLEEAVKTYKRVIGLEEDLSDYAPAWFGLGEVYLSQEKNDVAKKAFDRTIERQPGNAAAYYGRAIAEAQIGADLVQAIRDLRQAITLEEKYLQKAEDEPVIASLIETYDFSSAKQKFEAGQIDEREGNLEDVIQKYQEAIQLDPLNDAYHAALAEAYTELPAPNWTEAEITYLQAIELYPDRDIYNFNLGEVYAVQGKYEKAVESFTTAIKLSRDNDNYHFRLGEVYAAQSNYEDAKGSFEKAIELSPENDTYHYRLGEVYAMQGNYEQAKNSFEEAIEINGEEAIYHDRLSAAQFENGLEGEAISEGEAAKQLEPENLDYRLHLAEIYRQIKSWNRAIINYTQILELNPEYGDAYCGLSMVYYQSGEAEGAEAAFQRCQQLSFNDNLKDEVEAEKARFEGR